MDGKRCPLKADTNEERERNRQANLSEARAYQKQGRRDKAEEKYKMCIKIKDELTFAVMKEVKQAFHNNPRLHLVWSPYEADAQLAKLCIDGIADAVITEVSTGWGRPKRLTKQHKRSQDNHNIVSIRIRTYSCTRLRPIVLSL